MATFNMDLGVYTFSTLRTTSARSISVNPRRCVMRDLLPIKQGCRALIICGLGAGKEVRVGLFVGPWKWGKGGDWWEVDPIGWEPAEHIHRLCRERHMMRLDGHKEESEITVEEKENVAL